ncbi:DUF4440 domain-containing protein [Luteimonas sp. R10]|uniref:nuclear transport factor 2 family protein n=1 Tax=Luteimonas sp. R10 TaxID=3108176 RepID=UPI003084B0D6|nr:DUF4440 domain-containing protein [Luteimonas sp. R10]
MATADESLHAHLSRLELALLSADVRTSAEALARLLADDFREIGASGHMFGKDEVLVRLPCESGVAFATEAMEVRELAAGLAQVTYRATRSAEGETRRSWRSSLWRRGAAGWSMVFHQGTPLADGADIGPHVPAGAT